MAAGLLLLSGCSGIRPRLGTDASSAARSPEWHLIANVPFFPDRTDQCGPSALTSLLNYWGRDVGVGEIKREIYVSGLKGTLPMDLAPAARSRGLGTEVLNGTPADLKDQIRAGRPIIVYLNRGFRVYPIGHFVVVTGYDDRKKGFYAHSGLQRDHFIPYRRFLPQWKRTNAWMLIVAPVSDQRARQR